ncbi:capsid protein [Bacillus swezeyi]|uniref:phage tail tube protein n=1 Tax=Bacillus swezeyi TaxID=1925020 RepID=UPI002E1ED8D0|nr:capsid protein [Bacillus swezeyi]
MPKDFPLQFKNEFSLDVTPDGATQTFERLAAGLKTVEPNNNENIDQTPYYDGNGMADSDVTGGQLVFTCTLDRVNNDPVQDYILSKIFEFGVSRRTTCKWKTPQGELIEGPVTIANIAPPGGDANAKGEWTFEIHFNGKPTVTPAP